MIGDTRSSKALLVHAMQLDLGSYAPAPTPSAVSHHINLPTPTILALSCPEGKF